jgi:hypothetical protein
MIPEKATLVSSNTFEEFVLVTETQFLLPTLQKEV